MFDDFCFCFVEIGRLLTLVETGIVKFMLGENLTNAEICPQNLGGTERQLRNSDLSMTYWIMLTGFCTSIVIFFTEVSHYNLSHSNTDANYYFDVFPFFLICR